MKSDLSCKQSVATLCLHRKIAILAEQLTLTHILPIANIIETRRTAKNQRMLRT